jgi:ElaB/YqjD/DUF883 family membrane-anchored ribosome-binding protein
MMSGTMDKIERGAMSATDEIRELRAQVENLMRERVTPALANAADAVETRAKDAVHAVRRQSDSLAEQIREQPLMAVGMAAVIGYVIARITR